jgi:hypothetical protein
LLRAKIGPPCRDELESAGVVCGGYVVLGRLSVTAKVSMRQFDDQNPAWVVGGWHGGSPAAQYRIKG